MKNIDIIRKAVEKSNYISIMDEYDGGFTVIGEFGDTESSACYNEDSDPDYIGNSLWMDFGGWEHFMGDANNHILYNYSEKLEQYLSEEDLRDIEFGEGWYENYSDKIPEDMYYEISKAIEEEYEKASKAFDAFKREFESDIWDINREAIKAENEEKNEVIYAEYGCPDWAKEKNYSYSDFLYMCAGDACAIPGLLMESIDSELNDYERVIDYTILENNGRKYFVKTDDDRVLCLNDLM